MIFKTRPRRSIFITRSTGSVDDYKILDKDCIKISPMNITSIKRGRSEIQPSSRIQKEIHIKITTIHETEAYYHGTHNFQSLLLSLISGGTAQLRWKSYCDPEKPCESNLQSTHIRFLEWASLKKRRIGRRKLVKNIGQDAELDHMHGKYDYFYNHIAHLEQTNEGKSRRILDSEANTLHCPQIFTQMSPLPAHTQNEAAKNTSSAPTHKSPLLLKTNIGTILIPAVAVTGITNTIICTIGLKEPHGY